MLDSKPFLNHRQAPLHFAVDDPVGSLDHSFPIRPDHGSSRPQEYWEDQLNKKRPRKPVPKLPPGKSDKDNHQIDDYA